MRRLAALAAVLLLAFGSAAPADAQSGDEPVVRAVLFFLPTCGHCHKVINEDLPVIFDTYGGEWELRFDDTLPPEDVSFYMLANGTLELLVVDASVSDGQAMYNASTDSFEIPDEMRGVPRMIVGDVYLVGSVDIPEVYPQVIAEALGSGGLDWPDIAGLEAALETIPDDPYDPDGSTTSTDDPAATTTEAGDPTTTEDPATTEPGETTTTAAPTTTTDPGDGGSVIPVAGDGDSITDRIGRDPLGNGIAIAVLAAMVASLVAVHLMVRRGSLNGGAPWAVPLLGIVGLGVSIYLASVEVSGSTATCGPVGDCNAVQQSEYAELFGIPIGVIGIVGYAVLLTAWAVTRLRDGLLADVARLTILGVALGGTVFSVYLTFLEPFVIGATCAWCLTSAIAITLLLWVSAAPGWAAFGRLRQRVSA